jgi:hypothetical protein
VRSVTCVVFVCVQEVATQQAARAAVDETAAQHAQESEELRRRLAQAEREWPPSQRYCLGQRGVCWYFVG